MLPNEEANHNHCSKNTAPQKIGSSKGPQTPTQPETQRNSDVITPGVFQKQKEDLFPTLISRLFRKQIGPAKFVNLQLVVVSILRELFTVSKL